MDLFKADQKNFRRDTLVWRFVIALLLIGLSAQVGAQECLELRQFTFSWQFADDCNMQPRGGTTTGPEVTLEAQPYKGWLAIQEKGLSKFERDRLAILAMAGPYRTSFDFLEVAGYQLDYEPVEPYQSWATEYVYVLEDSDEFISLQHIIVMFFQDGDEVSGPHVVKHWRQDWAYEKASVLAYVGNQTWELQPVPEDEIAGSWSQAVYQVDDSPRYESWGNWEHNSSFSSWESATTWRPLPRREFSVRDDYQVLEGSNRHSILPNGWLHEEANYKRVLEKESETGADYLAKELGVNRYERIVGHDFSAGDEYLERTGAFWADVRSTWDQLKSEQNRIELDLESANTPMFLRLFEAAEQFSGDQHEIEESRETIREIIDGYLQ